MKNYVLTIVLLAMAASAASSSNVPPMPKEYLADPAEVVRIAEQVTSRRFPDADVVLIDDRVHTAYEPDGTNVCWDDEWVKILTEKGRRAYASLSLSVSLRYGDAAFELVEIIGTNGVARTIDFARTLKMATDNSSVSANIYDPLDKKMSCAVPGLAVGEIRHVRYCRRMLRPRMKGTWADTQLLEYTTPIMRTRITVDQPDARPVKHAVIRHPFGKTVTRLPDRPLGAGRTLLAWDVRDVPQAFTEPSMPPISTEVQALRLSTADDWPSISKWYWKMCEPHLAAGSPEMTNKVHETVRGLSDASAKIRALFRFVSQEIRYMGITTETEAPGYEPHDVSLTFGNRYGVCRDKAALLAEMLRIAGFDARPVLIRVGAKMDPEIPSPYFNHAIAAVKEPGRDGWTLMDPTDEAARDLLPSYLSDCSYLVASPEGEVLRISPVTPVSGNMLSADSEGSLEPDGSVMLSTRLTFGGINDTAFRHMFVKQTEEKRRLAVEGMLRRVMPGAELLSCDVTPADLSDTDTPLALRTVTRFPEAVMRGETRDSLSLPLVTRVFSLARVLLSDSTSLEKRRFPLEFSSTAGSEERLVLKLGDVVGAPRMLPEEVNAGTGTGYEYLYRVTVTNGVLSAHRRQLVKDIRFEPSAYDTLRDNLKIVESMTRADPTFEIRTDSNADIRTLLSRGEIVFASPFSWVQTNIVEKEVLTYKGKKSSAELKFSYSPVVRKVELVSATVSNKNGSVQSVTPKEMHLLDCGWAASAPRYPASKTLVVNLPGVSVGSVIRYVVAYTVTNSPTAYTSFMTFDSTQPTERITVKVTVPDGMPFKWRSTGFKDGVADRIELEDRISGARRFAWSVKNPRRLPNEPSQPAASLWRTTLFLTAAEWDAYADGLLSALSAARAAGSDVARSTARRVTANCSTPQEKIVAIRTFLAHNMRIAGPGLFDLPFDMAFFPPDRSLADSYASSADRCNLAFAMLEATGFDCSFVLATDDSHGMKEMTRLYQEGLPRPGFFSCLAIRASAGGRTFYLAGENEYTPPDCSTREGDTYFDPQTLSFGEVRLEEPAPSAWWAPWTWFSGGESAMPGKSVWSPRDDNFCRMTVREDGGVDFDVTNRAYGAGVGGFRKRFIEMLPEKRSRFYQSLLGGIAESATATRDLVTDTESYPAVTSLSAFVPAYATAHGGEITVRVPDFDDGFLSVGGPLRKSPIHTGGATETIDTYEIVFPKGFTSVESLPEPYVLANPADSSPWVTFKVDRRTEDGRLVVTLVRVIHRRTATVLGADYFPFIRDWNRRMAAPAGRTITVRRAHVRK